MFRMLGVSDAAWLANLHALSFEKPWDSKEFIGLFESGAVGLAFEGMLTSFILLRRVLDEAEVLTLATHPDFRRRGLAGRLLAEAESALAKQGVSRFFLEVRMDNVAAQKLYQQAGYEVMSQRRNYYMLPDGTQCDALVMQKTIFEDGGSGRS